MKRKNDIQPPKWAIRFLHWFCSGDLLEEVEGDIYEMFERRIDESGEAKARRFFIWDVIRFFNYSTIMGRQPRQAWQPSPDMFRNYLKIAFRNLIRQKEYSLINIIGLSIGLTIMILMSIYGKNELSFDAFHTKSDRIYRVLDHEITLDQGPRTYAATPAPLGKALIEDFPQFTHSVPLMQMGQSVVIINDTLAGNIQRFNERNYLFAGADFFEVFDFKLLQGNPTTALKLPGQIILTKSTAKKYFGEKDPMGKTITNNRAGELIVSGIAADPPLNSHLRFDFIVSMETVLANERGRAYFNSWSRSGVYHYVLANDPVDVKALQPQLDAFENKYRENPDDLQQISLQLMTDVHFGSKEVEYELVSSEESKRSKTYLDLFAWVSFIILLIAGINYVNLSTARAIRRGKEVGIRKVAGARRGQLISQFLVESMLTAVFALIIAVGLSYALLGYFNQITDKHLSFNLLQDPKLALYLISIALGVGFFSGILPALLLSNFKIVSILKGKFRTNTSGVNLRRILVVSQFAATLFILISTVIGYQQMNYIQTKDLGFDKDQLVVVDINSGAARSGFEVFKEEFLKHPDIHQVSATSRVPGEWKNISQITLLPGNQSNRDSLSSLFFCFDKEAIATFGMELIHGQNFSGNTATDSSSFLLNETAVSMLGLEDPIGKEISVTGVHYSIKIIGVVKDFHVRSLHEPIGPIAIGYWENPIRAIDYFTCRISGKNIPQTLAHLEKVQSELDPQTPLEYHFLDKQIELFYKEDSRVNNIFLISAILTLLIACMGLFGLVSYAIIQRTKEIGVRKVLGASASQLYVLLSKDIVTLIGIALIIAVPFSWWSAVEWLSGFAFGVSINWVIFAAAGIVVIVIAMLTVSFHIIQLVRKNPVDALRYE